MIAGSGSVITDVILLEQMTISKLKLLKTRVKAFKSSLESSSTSERQQKASVQTTQHLNKLIDETASDFADLAPSLPAKLRSMSIAARRAGVSDHSYMDVEIMIDQILALLELIDED